MKTKLMEGYGSPFARILMDNQEINEASNNKPMVGTDISTNSGGDILLQLPPISAEDIISLYNKHLETLLDYDYGDVADDSDEAENKYLAIKNGSLKSIKALGVKNGIIRFSGVEVGGDSVTFNLKIRSLQWVNNGVKLSMELENRG